MSRYAGLGLALFACMLIGGCSDSEPAASPSAPSTSVDTPSVDSTGEEAVAAVPAEAATQEAPAVKEEPVSEPPAMEAPAAATPVEETKPTVLSAIGKAMAGALGTSDDGPSEAPAYKPAE